MKLRIDADMQKSLLHGFIYALMLFGGFSLGAIFGIAYHNTYVANKKPIKYKITIETTTPFTIQQDTLEN